MPHLQFRLLLSLAEVVADDLGVSRAHLVAREVFLAPATRAADGHLVSTAGAVRTRRGVTGRLAAVATRQLDRRETSGRGTRGATRQLDRREGHQTGRHGGPHATWTDGRDVRQGDTGGHTPTGQTGGMSDRETRGATRQLDRREGRQTGGHGGPHANWTGGRDVRQGDTGGHTPTGQTGGTSDRTRGATRQLDRREGRQTGGHGGPHANWTGGRNVRHGDTGGHTPTGQTGGTPDRGARGGGGAHANWTDGRDVRQGDTGGHTPTGQTGGTSERGTRGATRQLDRREGRQRGGHGGPHANWTDGKDARQGDTRGQSIVDHRFG